MAVDRIKDLMNKGYITQVVDPNELAKFTEAQLIEKGYITMVGIFDGLDATVEEVPAEATPSPASNDDDLTPAADPDDAPVVDDGDEPTTTDPEDEE